MIDRTLKLPSGVELDAARDGKFGKGNPGTVMVDADPATGRVDLVFADEDGVEAGRKQHAAPFVAPVAADATGAASTPASAEVADVSKARPKQPTP